MRLSPPFPELYYNRADARAALGDLDGAIADFRHVLEIDPEDDDASVNLAGLLANLGHTTEAAAAFEHSAQLRPDATVLFNLGAAREQAGRHKEALTAYSSALDLAPEDDDVRTAIARCAHA